MAASVTEAEAVVLKVVVAVDVSVGVGWWCQ